MSKRSLVRRLLVGVGLILVVLVIVVLLAIGWLLGTHSGLLATLDLVQRISPDTIVVERATGRLLGPITLSDVQLELPGVEGRIEGVELDWQPMQLFSGVAVIDHLSLSGVVLRLVHTEDDSEEPETALELPDSLEAPIDVRVSDLQLTQMWVHSGDSQIRLDSVAASGSWIDTQIDVSQLAMRAPLFDVDSSAQVSARDAYPMKLDARLSARPVDYTPFTAELRVSGDVEKSQLNLDVNNPYNLNLAVTLRELVEDLQIEASLSGEPKELSTLSKALPPIAPILRASAVGTPNELRFEVNSEADYQGQNYVATISGTGKTTALSVEAFELNTGAGSLRGTAAVDWLENLTARLALNGQQFNPAVYVPDLPGALDIGLRIDMAHSRTGEFSVNLSELKVTGELLELPVQATGVASLSGDSVDAKDLVLEIGNNRLKLDGNVGKRSNFRWLLNLEDVDQFSALAGVPMAGALNGGGRFEGAIENPGISAQLSASKLVVDEQSIDTLDFRLDGSRRDHTYQLLVETPQADLEFAGKGDFQMDDRWRYELEDLLVTHAGLDPKSAHHEWGLEESTGGFVSAQKLRAQSLCLVHRVPLDGGKICVSAIKEAAGELQLTGELEKLQLAELNTLLDDTLRVKGELGGEFLWSGVLQRSSADLNLLGFSIALEGRDGWQDALEFEPGLMTLLPEATGALTFDLDLPLADEHDHSGLFVDAELVPQSGAAPDSWPLTARMAIELPDMAWLAAFNDQLDELDASLSGELTFEGTPSAPTFGGATLLSVPKLSVNELGIELLNTTVELAAKDNQLVLSGTTRSGDGELQLSGNVNWADGLNVVGAITGEDFEVSLRGEVAVPLANVRLAKVPDGAISASADQRFAEEEEAPVPLDVDVRVQVKLGEDVRFTGLGLEAQFGGELTVSEQSTGATTGKGEILIKEGTYKAYGQDLSVENGKLIFAGGSIEAPGLDIRAARQATPDVMVGVQVQGSLDAPKLDVFSTPQLPQSDQLSYLVLGRSLSESSASENSILQQAAFAIGVEGGTLLTDRVGKNLGVDTFTIESEPGTGAAQAALVVGKFLSPRLYVSYGYGLFQPISTLRMEYQLNKLLRVVTQSTNEATGGDLFWVRER